MKKLKDPTASLGTFLPRIELLGDRLGPLLFQLPPKWRFNAGRLAAFLDVLPDRHRYALEFRDDGWINDAAVAQFAARRAAFCIYELAGYPSRLEVTTELAQNHHNRFICIRRFAGSPRKTTPRRYRTQAAILSAAP